jgi:hypothetical protein
MRVAVEPFRQGRQVRRSEGYRLSGEATERTLIATMAGRRVLARDPAIVDVGAELRRVSEKRLEFGRYRRVVGAGEGGRRQSRRRGGGEKLNDEREGDEEGGQTRARLTCVPPCASPSQRRGPAPEVHPKFLRTSESVPERVRERNCMAIARKKRSYVRSRVDEA